MTMTLNQPSLPLAAARIKRPTVDRNGAKAIIDVEDWQMDALVDIGAVRGVINIASRDADRRELRFAAVCLAEYLRALPAAAPAHSDEEIAGMIFGHEPMVRAWRAYRALNCKSSHFYDLIRQRLIVLPRNATRRTGPGGSAVVERAALVKFITDRRVA